MSCSRCGSTAPALHGRCRTCGTPQPADPVVATGVMTPPPPVRPADDGQAPTTPAPGGRSASDSPPWESLESERPTGAGAFASPSAPTGSGGMAIGSETPTGVSGQAAAPDSPTGVSGRAAEPEAPTGVAGRAAAPEAPTGGVAARAASPDAPTGSGTSGTGRGLGPLTVGNDFGSRYHIIRLLGAGGMGAVYQAWDKILEVAVAVKVIRPPDARSRRRDLVRCVLPFSAARPGSIRERTAS